MKKIVLITKDAVSKDYLPVYGNSYWQTPNMDELAKKGTVFNRHYTVAASTAMAFYSMITGQNCFETKCTDYGDERPFEGKTIFEKFSDNGYSTYLIWDKTYADFAKTHLQVIEGKTNQIALNIIPHITPHIKGKFDDLSFDNADTKLAMDEVYNCFKVIANKNEKAFIWIHLPHVLSGRNAYCSDIDLFDEVVGYAREFFGDDNLFISADHGNMDGKNNKFGYGFDLYEPAICIPLITPKYKNMDTVDFVTSNIHLYELLNMNVVEEYCVVSDTAYYCQPKRKVALIKGKYKLVFCKEENRFKLFDLSWDPNEKYNLYYPEYYDADRMSWFSLNQRFYYPYWDEALLAKEVLLKEFIKIWKKGTFVVEKKNLIKFYLKYIYAAALKDIRSKRIKNIGK